MNFLNNIMGGGGGHHGGHRSSRSFIFWMLI